MTTNTRTARRIRAPLIPEPSEVQRFLSNVVLVSFIQDHKKAQNVCEWPSRPVADETSGFIYARPALILQLSAVTQKSDSTQGLLGDPFTRLHRHASQSKHTTRATVNTLWAGLWGVDIVSKPVHRRICVQKTHKQIGEVEGAIFRVFGHFGRYGATLS